ncbi:hypothetical protein F4777DRAFT_251882 [Nemania sp. FL0916]|nr:hypothetical protein F4777DRAFT_251882 [Nemania sp. FL0916]
MGMESLPTVGSQPSAFHEPPHRVFLDSLSWLDEDDDLDLRLALDDYRPDIKPSSPVTSTGPSSLFRYRLPVNKLSLGRSSVSSTRPGTRDSSVEQIPQGIHARRKSRALSLVTPKHGPQVSISSIDPTATHYQDPEARQKLRTYLASPQNFDEALEFGFPATKTHLANSSELPLRRSRSFSRSLAMASSEKLKTFLADDRSSVYSQETSIPESESPRTPHTPEIQMHNHKPFALTNNSVTLPSKLSECYSGPITSREMTLRMTLTRPDLRSLQEDGSSNGLAPHQPRPRSRPFRVDSPVSASDNDATKESMDQIFADIDRELGSSEGVVKRFWNRVRRG